MRRIILFFVLLGSGLTLLAQETNTNKQGFLKAPLSVSYFGETFFHPGIKVGQEYTLWNRSKVKIKQKGEKEKTRIRRHYLLGLPAVGWSWHPKNRHVLFAETGLAYRLTFKKGFRQELTISTGAMRTLLARPTWEVLPNGEIQRVYGAGQWAFMPGFAYGFGKDYRFAKASVLPDLSQSPWAWHFRMGGFWQLPYNTATVFYPKIEAGITWYFVNPPKEMR